MISSKLMKRTGSTMYMLHPQGRLLATKYWFWNWVNLVRTKPAIQGLVHCSSYGWVWLEALVNSSTYKSLLKHWYINNSEKHSKCLTYMWGGERDWRNNGLGPWHIRTFQIKFQRPMYGRESGGCGWMVQTFSLTLLVDEWDDQHKWRL